MTVRKCLLVILMILSFAAVTARADHVFLGWDDGGDGGWQRATAAAVMEIPLTGGLAGGYLSTYETVFNYGIVGAITYQAECTGSFSCHAYQRLQVAVRFMGGNFTKAYAHVRYMDSSHNGWQLPLGADLGSTDWQIFFIDFDPAWTDQQALDAGWVQESASASFSLTMENVYSMGIKGEGTDALSMGIDHFALQDAATSEESMTWGDIKSLYR